MPADPCRIQGLYGVFRRFLCLITLLQLSACSSVFFYPEKNLVRTPADLNLSYQDVYFHSRDQTRLHGWLLTTPGTPRGTVYFLHGNAENISTHIGSVHWLPAQGYQVFLLDYRGFGRSEGQATVADALDDIHAGLHWLLTQHKRTGRPVFLLGQSLGASLGLYFAATDPLARQHLSAVISDAAFTGYAAIARHVACQSRLTCWLQALVGWSMVRGYDALEQIKQVSPLPLLILHSQDDAIVPYRFSEQLFRAARQPKQFLLTQGAHITTFQQPAYRQTVLNFMHTAGR